MMRQPWLLRQSPQTVCFGPQPSAPSGDLGFVNRHPALDLPYPAYFLAVRDPSSASCVASVRAAIPQSALYEFLPQFVKKLASSDSAIAGQVHNFQGRMESDSLGQISCLRNHHLTRDPKHIHGCELGPALQPDYFPVIQLYFFRPGRVHLCTCPTTAGFRG
jgi:hypothetical protein